MQIGQSVKLLHSVESGVALRLTGVAPVIVLSSRPENTPTVSRVGRNVLTDPRMEVPSIGHSSAKIWPTTKTLAADTVIANDFRNLARFHPRPLLLLQTLTRSLILTSVLHLP